MNAFELFNEHGKPCGVWCCGKCRKLVLSPIWAPDSIEPRSTKEAAEKCCTPRLCKCGEPTSSDYSAECNKCCNERMQSEHHKTHAKRLLKAVDVTGAYDGPVYVEGHYGGDMGDGYFSSAERAAESLEEDDDDPRTGVVWVFACTPEVRQLDLSRALENLCDDGYEDIGSDLVIPPALQAEVDKFNQENEVRLTCWEADYKRKIKIVITAERP